MVSPIINTKEKNGDTSKTAIGEWFGDWGGRALVAYGVFVGIYILYPFLYSAEEASKALISNIVTIVVYSGPAILAWRVSAHPSISPRSSWGWRSIALAHIAVLIASIQWLYFDSILGESPFPSWADVTYLTYYPVMMAGLLLLVEKMRSAEERLNFAFDSSVILIGGGMALWYFLLRPIAQAHAGTSDTLTMVLSLAYPVADLVLLLGISSLLLRRTSVASRGVINLLLLGVIVNFSADFLFGYQSLAGTYETGNTVDTLYSLACLPIMMAAHCQYVTASRNGFAEASDQTSFSRFFWVPYISVAVVYLVLLKVALEHDTEIVESAILVAGFVTALVIFRQFMFLRENTKANIALTEMQERIHGIYSASTDAIGLADFEGTITEVNDSFVRLTGLRRDEIVGTKRYHDFVPDDYMDRSVTPEMVIDNGRPVEYESELKRKDGSSRNIATTLYTVNDGNGDPAAMAVVVRDITDRRSLEHQLTHQALHDPLTGLANRSLLTTRVNTALRRARRQGSKVAVLFLDLDNFKIVNDSLGHAAGDSLLITVSERLQACLRASDMAARLGGDEFAVLIEDIHHSGEEIPVAERLLASIRNPIDINGKEVFVGSSIGIALSAGNIDATDELLRNADVAMYTAKKGGKNRYAIYEDAMHAAVLRRARIETGLRHALDGNEFEIHYQPIFDLANRGIVAIEALLRWNNPRHPNVGPAEFIPIAEEANLIGPIGGMVLREACSQAARWQKTYSPDEAFAISVNISGRQFLDPDFIPMLKKAYTKGGLKPTRLILEITESTMLSNSEAMIAKLNEIKKLGIKLAVDDFGTGYSSLSYLHKFPIDILKIDRSFVEKVTEGDEGAAMARAIISMSETLRLRTIAEGIETPTQAGSLHDMNCGWGQGYYFAKPLTADGMDEFLRDAYIQNTMVLPKSLVGPGTRGQEDVASAVY